MKKKVLLTITKSNFGGAQRYVFDMARALKTEGAEVAVALGGTGEKGGAPGSLEDKLRESGIRTHFVRAFMRDISLAREWKALRELMHLYATEKPDVVHLNSSKAGGLGALAARLSGVPHIIFTVHGLPQDEDRSSLSRLLIAIATWGTFLLCHRVIAVSKDNAERTRRFPFCAAKVRLVHNGIEPFQMHSHAKARELLNLPQDAFVIGALGELTPNKNYPVLIRAAAELKREGRVFTLCIMGGGEEEVFLQTLAEEVGVADRVRFAGFMPDAKTLLPAYDIFALTSLKEGLPYVALEAGTAGLAVVGSDIPGIREIVKEDGLLFPPRNEHALKDALKRLMDDAPLRKTLGSGLKKTVEKEFSLAHMVRATREVYAD